ncbi:hypothetical protein G6L68_25510 [Agrobacterium fabrum]|uniref:hypothetical protein n=1 Tax=Agrobacterium fabrum TaxID=1176649 RepID=UPI000EF5A85C|nr:hypothetical protein [Agrobacterium fabrum]AYM66145.1 hypothetical protein At12D13_49930 [Agrobacterium fabrum]NTE63993.1 hypothetical protein [Agrobacterium fabrum]
MSLLTAKITERLKNAACNSGVSGDDHSTIQDIIWDMLDSGFVVEGCENRKDDLIVMEQFFIHGAEKFCAEGRSSLSKVFVDLAIDVGESRDAEIRAVAAKGQRLASFFMPLKDGVKILKPAPEAKAEPKPAPAPLPIPATTGPISTIDYSGYDPDWQEKDDGDWECYRPERIARLMRPDLYPGPDENYHFWSERQYPPETKAERRGVEQLALAITETIEEMDRW